MYSRNDASKSGCCSNLVRMVLAISRFWHRCGNALVTAKRMTPLALCASCLGPGRQAQGPGESLGKIQTDQTLRASAYLAGNEGDWIASRLQRSPKRRAKDLGIVGFQDAFPYDCRSRSRRGVAVGWRKRIPPRARLRHLATHRGKNVE